jgi:hypothetical protein
LEGSGRDSRAGREGDGSILVDCSHQGEGEDIADTFVVGGSNDRKFSCPLFRDCNRCGG